MSVVTWHFVKLRYHSFSSWKENVLILYFFSLQMRFSYTDCWHLQIAQLSLSKLKSLAAEAGSERGEPRDVQDAPDPVSPSLPSKDNEGASCSTDVPASADALDRSEEELDALLMRSSVLSKAHGSWKSWAMLLFYQRSCRTITSDVYNPLSNKICYFVWGCLGHKAIITEGETDLRESIWKFI